MLRSAAYRIAVVTAATFAIVTIALGLSVYLAVHATLQQQLDDRIAEQARALQLEFVSEGPRDMVRAITEHEQNTAAGELGYALFDPLGRRIDGQMDTAAPAPGFSTIRYRGEGGTVKPARAFTTVLPDGSRMVVAARNHPLEHADRTILVLFAGAFVIVLIIGGGGALLLGGYLQQRLSQISDTAEAIMAGNLDQRVPVGPRADEFDRLATLLNAMLDRVTELVDNLRQVSSDVAHDLRTPLTGLRNALERGLAHAHPPDERDATIRRAIGHSDDVLNLFAALLHISEIEAGGLTVGAAPLDLTRLVHEIVDSYAPAIADDGRRLDFVIAEDVHIAGHRELLAQAMINLLDNAQLHTPAGTAIRVTVVRDGGRVRVTVADNGPGVPVTERARVLRRFARLDNSRSLPGHGLGLSLVAAIARMHDAVLTLADNGPGLSVTIEFARYGG